jgi:hypothetical protein
LKIAFANTLFNSGIVEAVDITNNINDTMNAMPIIFKFIPITLENKYLNFLQYLSTDILHIHLL